MVDDNADAADSLAWLLRHGKHEVRTAHTTAGKRSSWPTPSDRKLSCSTWACQAENRHGYEVAARLRQHADTRGALLVALSGYGQQEHRRRSSEAGFDYHFVKPVDFAALQRILLEVHQTCSGRLVRVESG